MTQRSYALDGGGVVHTLLDVLRDHNGCYLAMCSASPLLIVEGPLTCMSCFAVALRVELTTELINKQLEGFIGAPCTEETRVAMAARLLELAT